MSRVLTKKQKRLKKEANKRKKIKKMEKQDSLGISRGKRKKYIFPKLFSLLKIISIISYPVAYFLYSPLLICCVIFTISLFYFSTLVENYHNHTFIKKNHIKVNKIDSIFAVVLLIITICGAIGGIGSRKKMSFFNAWMQIKMAIENFGSCLTGKRGLLNGFGMRFGMKEPPGDMPMPSPPEGMRPPADFNFSEMPFDVIFSSALTSICTALIVIIPTMSIITLCLYYKKKNKFNKIMNDVISDNYVQFTDEQYFKLFTFGYDTSQEIEC